MRNISNLTKINIDHIKNKLLVFTWILKNITKRNKEDLHKEDKQNDLQWKWTSKYLLLSSSFKQIVQKPRKWKLSVATAFIYFFSAKMEH